MPVYAHDISGLHFISVYSIGTHDILRPFPKTLLCQTFCKSCRTAYIALLSVLCLKGIIKYPSQISGAVKSGVIILIISTVRIVAVLRICLIVAVGVIGFAFAGLLDDLEQGLWEKVQGEARLIWCGICAGMVCWLYGRGFCAMTYDNYGAILRPGISFLTLTLGICVIRILWKDVPKEERLLSGLVFFLVLLTSIGSNNGVYPSLNHLFLPAPYTIWQCVRFMRQAKRRALWAVKPALVALLLLFLVQSALFGHTFVFAEATGAKILTLNAAHNISQADFDKGVRLVDLMRDNLVVLAEALD